VVNPGIVAWAGLAVGRKTWAAVIVLLTLVCGT
jgi:hypothetical protein